jgi:hypothetical protein
MKKLLLLALLALVVGVVSGEILWGDEIIWGTTPQTVVADDGIVWGN